MNYLFYHCYNITSLDQSSDQKLINQFLEPIPDNERGNYKFVQDYNMFDKHN